MIRMPREKRNPYVIFAVMLSSTLMGSLLQTALSTLLPSIMGDFAVSAAQAQWLNTSYSLVMGMIIPASAFLLQRFSTRRLYLTSLLLFLIGSLLCSVASDFSSMLVGRILQAAASGLCMSMLQVVVLTLFPRKQQGTMMGVYGVASSVAPAFAPALAGMIAETMGWRTVFTGSVAVYMVVLGVSVFFMRDVLPHQIQRFDFLSFVICGLGFAGVTIGAGQLSKGWEALLPFGLGLGCLFAFVIRQLKAEQPFLDVRVLSNSRCRTATIVSMLLYAALIAGSTLTPMFQQMVCGLSPSVSGLILMPGSLVTALLSPMAGRWYDKRGIRMLSAAGAVMLLLSNLGYCMAGAGTSVIVLALLAIMRNIAVGCTMMPVFTWGMSTLSQQQTPHGTALLTSLRTIAGGIGSALLVGIASMVSALEGVHTTVTSAGMRMAFAGMTMLSAVQLVMVVCGVLRNGEKERRMKI